ncbi:MAG: Obg family GTPase CgtA [Desulfitobacteriaceae bacterium]
MERHLAMTYFESDEGLRRFQKILSVMGIDNALRAQGIKVGDKVKIVDLEFEWEE